MLQLLFAHLFATGFTLPFKKNFWSLLGLNHIFEAFVKEKSSHSSFDLDLTLFGKRVPQTKLNEEGGGQRKRERERDRERERETEGKKRGTVQRRPVMILDLDVFILSNQTQITGNFERLFFFATGFHAFGYLVTVVTSSFYLLILFTSFLMSSFMVHFNLIQKKVLFCVRFLTFINAHKKRLFLAFQ